MNKIVHDMLKIYAPLDFDWMNYKIVRKDMLTGHHIIKKCNGGPKTQDNMALLIETSHQYLHLIEFKDPESYTLINRVFKEINEQRSAPTPEQRQFIENILLMFEKEHKNDKGSKGKTLIKHKYKQRW